MLHGQVKLEKLGEAFKYHTVIAQQCDRWHRHAKKLSYFTRICNCTRRVVTGSREKAVVWKDENEGSEKSFFGYVKMFNDNTAKIINSTVRLVSPLHIVLLSCSEMFQSCLVENGCIVVGFPMVT